MSIIMWAVAITSLIAICSASFALIAMGIDIVKNWRDEK